jgi:y4mF family transcriptional regulator
MNLEIIGRIIRNRREGLKLRQEDLAELSDINSRTIHQVENGTGNPSIKTLLKIVDVLGLELSLDIKKLN